MLYVENGVYLLETSPAAHNYTYNEGRSGAAKTMLTPFEAGQKITSSSGYNGYMRGSEPSPNDQVYSSLNFSVSGGTTHEVTQAAEVDAQGRTVYVRYINGTRNANIRSYNEPWEFSYTVTSWKHANPEGDYTAAITVTGKYRNNNGTYSTTTNSMGKTDVLLRQGDRTQTDYAYSISESVS